MKKYFSSYWIRSATYVFLQRFSLTLFGFISFILLIRILTKSELGVWGLFLAITGIFESTKSNLLKNAHIRYVSSSDDTSEKTTIASSSFLINFSISFFFILLIVFFSEWLSHWLNLEKELASMLKWFIPGLLFMIFFSHLEATQQSHLDFKGVFAGHFVRQLFFLCVIVFYKVTKQPLSLTTIVMYQSISIALGSAVLYIFTRKYLLHRFDASIFWVKKITGYGGYILGSGTVANIYSSLDQFITARFMNSSSVAYYNVANRINGLIDIPSYAAAEIIFPKASRASIEEGPERVKYLFEKMVSILIAFTIPVALFIIIFPRLITGLIAGHSYAAAAPILQLYMITGIFRPVQNQAANLLNSIGKPRLVFFLNSATLGLLLLINYLCLLRFGFYGVAIGTMITTIIGFIAWYFIMRKEIGLNMKTVFRYSLETYQLLYNKGKAMLGNRSKTAD